MPDDRYPATANPVDTAYVLRLVVRAQDATTVTQFTPAERSRC